MTAPTTAVIGGGWAGLAAAVEATLLGHAVTLFEMAPALGGRARRVVLADSSVVDNGQHICVGAYVETLRLLRTVGVAEAEAFLRLPLTLVDAGGRGLRLPAGAPVPAFARGVLAQRGWRWRDRVALLAAAAGWAASGFRCAPELSVADLAARLPAAVRRELIEPLCVAALNTPAARASAQVFLTVLHDALFSGAGSADLLLPKVDLSRLLPDPAAAWLARAGATLHLGRRVAGVARAGTGWRVDGTPFDGVVVAASAVEARRLVGPIDAVWSAGAAALEHEPIVTVYLRSAGTRLPQPMLALEESANRPAQFVFDRGQVGGPAGLLTFVISGARDWVIRGTQATLDATLDQARSALGRLLQGPLEVVGSITEKRATFRCTPGLRRPPMRIAPGLCAAGDHVEGPYPATLESAVRSGLAAARALAAADRPAALR